MATPAQTKYIEDLAVIKTKEFKEVKELLIAKGIIGENAETVKTADSLAQVANALTDAQASRFIDALVEHKAPARANAYAANRAKRTIAALDDIKNTINNWGF